jgi:hypothetical protein
MINNNIIDKCEECSHIQDTLCDVWICPTAKWKLGTCPSATHIDRGLKKVVDEKVRVGQLKGRRNKIKR